jgi:hypothetical protein
MCCHESGAIAARYFDEREDQKEFVMKRWIGVAVFASALAVAGPAAINSAAAGAPQIKAQAAAVSGATDFSAQRYHRRYYRYGYRPYYRPYYQPYYYARPQYYRPYPYYAPAPFPFGLGFGPLW